MLSNFIGGGQVFLHKVRMFSQVFYRTMHVSLLVGILISCTLNWSDGKKVDWDGFFSYRKAKFTIFWDDMMSDIKESLGKEDSRTATSINARSRNRVWQDVSPHSLIRMSNFQKADADTLAFITDVASIAGTSSVLTFIMIFLIWSRFGLALKSEKKKEGSGVVLTPKEVRNKLRAMSMASEFTIGKMPLVKNMETRHFLVTGATGSGKTNLIHNILPQVEKKKHPTVVITRV